MTPDEIYRFNKLATERELWIAHREQVKIGRAYALTAIIILSLALWGGIWLAVVAVSAWVSPWL